MEYFGEHTWLGITGKIMIVASFVMALLAAVFYGISCNEKLITYRRWRHNGKNLFRLHALILLGAFLLLLYAICNHYFEYRFVWLHSSRDMGLGYLIAASWAGQEGSLMFWTLMQALMGLYLMRYARNMEAPVMLVVSVVQVFVMMSIIGINYGSVKIGSSPFLLLREMPENLNNPFFQNRNYSSMILDGIGLNPLLMNFWMKLHPPVLFMGFSVLLVPFAFALASLIRKDYTGWLKPVLPWMSFSVLVFGCGIIMGGAWAYVDLTFGGFWAWDPVENLSLVPWMVIVIALHLVLVSIRKGQYIKLVYPLVFLSYLLVLYAAFMIRSGILNETSVHAFTGSKMAVFILGFLIILTLFSAFLYLMRMKHFPVVKKTAFFSREYWMYMASSVLLLAAFHILLSSSLPLINKVFNSNFSIAGANVEAIKDYYNTWQLPFVVVALFMMTLTQFMLYGANQFRLLLKRISFPFLLSCAISIFLIYYFNISKFSVVVLFFSALFASVSVIDYILRFGYRKANIASLISHFGLGVFILGIILAFYKSETLVGQAPTGIKNIPYDTSNYILLPKDEIISVGDYFVLYSGSRKENSKIIYPLDFLKKNASGQYVKAFSTKPSILFNPVKGNVYVPSAKNFPNKDIFTYIVYAEITNNPEPVDYNKIFETEIGLHDTVAEGNITLILDSLIISSTQDKISEENILITALIRLQTPDTNCLLKPAYLINNSVLNFQDAVCMNYKVRFERVSNTSRRIICGVYQLKKDYVIIKTTVYPYIILLWIGSILILTGFVVSVILRKKKAYRRKNEKDLTN